LGKKQGYSGKKTATKNIAKFLKKGFWRILQKSGFDEKVKGCRKFSKIIAHFLTDF
jgi:hypothetical protein